MAQRHCCPPPWAPFLDWSPSPHTPACLARPGRRSSAMQKAPPCTVAPPLGVGAASARTAARPERAQRARAACTRVGATARVRVWASAPAGRQAAATAVMLERATLRVLLHERERAAHLRKGIQARRRQAARARPDMQHAARGAARSATARRPAPWPQPHQARRRRRPRARGGRSAHRVGRQCGTQKTRAGACRLLVPRACARRLHAGISCSDMNPLLTSIIKPKHTVQCIICSHAPSPAGGAAAAPRRASRAPAAGGIASATSSCVLCLLLGGARRVRLLSVLGRGGVLLGNLSRCLLPARGMGPQLACGLGRKRASCCPWPWSAIPARARS